MKKVTKKLVLIILSLYLLNKYIIIIYVRFECKPKVYLIRSTGFLSGLQNGKGRRIK